MLIRMYIHMYISMKISRAEFNRPFIHFESTGLKEKLTTKRGNIFAGMQRLDVFFGVGVVAVSGVAVFIKTTKHLCAALACRCRSFDRLRAFRHGLATKTKNWRFQGGSVSSGLARAESRSHSSSHPCPYLWHRNKMRKNY